MKIRRKSETLKCFPTKCRKCGSKVLYWESTTGQKVFFNLPIYGKPVRHHCSINIKSKSMVKESYQDHKKKRIQKMISYTCPVCGKIFEKESSLTDHIKKLRHQDDYHHDFFEQFLDFLVMDSDKSEVSSEFSIQHKKSPFQTDQSLNPMQVRFILKTKNPEDRKKFENLLRRKKHNKSRD